jgi:hypothetical protein
MSGNKEVCIRLTQGPIYGLGDDGVEASYPLWGSIVAAECFPPGGASGGNYVLSIRKAVTNASEVPHSENQLIEVLKMLAAAWPFSGGSYMTIETRYVVGSPDLESNATALEQEMARSEEDSSGVSTIKICQRFGLDFNTTYSMAPLRVAADIVRLMHCDTDTERVLEYHQRAVIERHHPTAQDGTSWSSNLYKVRECLSKTIYENENEAQRVLGISCGQWRDFGNILNNKYDLRHARVSAPPIPTEVREEAYRTARSWVASHLRIKGIPAI